jgi:predicted amidohydrolase
MQLLACEPGRLAAPEAVAALTAHTERLVKHLSAVAVERRINIVAGSHVAHRQDAGVRNVSFVCRRDGRMLAQEKLHPTPNERDWWGVEGGEGLAAIPTDRGLIGVLVCYDAEFPELARRLADEGARIIFVPFCTDTREGCLRVRYCAQARAVENQLYVVTAGAVGNLPDVANVDIHYAQSAVITPCDDRFARDGVAAEAPLNVEAIIFADLDMTHLDWARSEGAVRNLAERRSDLYRIAWNDRSGPGD